MTTIKQRPNSREKTEDDIFIEEFVKDFFETNQHDNESSPSEKIEVSRDVYRNEKHKYKEKYDAKPTINAERRQREGHIDSQRNASKNTSKQVTRRPNSSDSIQILMNRFLELRNEFLSLSDRLHDASMSNVSTKLTQVLTERQRLVELLFNMDAASSSLLDPEQQKTRVQDQSREGEGISAHEFRMPRKAKSVHWSDEHLGGSIIQNPSARAHHNSYPTEVPRSGIRSHKHIFKPPPKYKMVDCHTQTYCNNESQTERSRDLNRCHCNIVVDREIEYVKELLDEAAELRREACCMIWQAHYLEQLCDVDGLVKHVYHSTSNEPTLPRYSRLYR